MAMEILNVTVTLRVPKAELDEAIRLIRSGELAPLPVPPAMMRLTANHHAQGSTDPEWRRIRVEYMK